jgi:hypothetical protein
VVVLDNLREGVLAPDIYEPTLNPLFKDVLAHYGVTALPCRVGDPDRKGKVESGVGHTQKTPLKGQRFESLEEAQEYLDTWESHWADTRIHGTTKRQVAAMFAEEKPTLLPLPLEPFRYYQYGERTVHLDGCVEVEAAFYSTPPGWIGRLVRVQWEDLHVRILDPKTYQLLREHVRQQRGGIASIRKTIPGKLPRPRRSFSLALLSPARKSAPSVSRFIIIVARAASAASRACSRWSNASVLPLSKTPVRPRWNSASHEYRFVRRYLERRPSTGAEANRSSHS